VSLSKLDGSEVNLLHLRSKNLSDFKSPMLSGKEDSLFERKSKSVRFFSLPILFGNDISRLFSNINFFKR
jgi:hypothetical protein